MPFPDYEAATRRAWELDSREGIMAYSDMSTDVDLWRQVKEIVDAALGGGDHQVIIKDGYLQCPRHSIMLVKSHRGSWSKYECPECADWYVSMRPIDNPDEEDQE